MSQTFSQIAKPTVRNALTTYTDIKVLYCFHQNNDDSKCEAVHTSPPIIPYKNPANLETRRGTDGTKSSYRHDCSYNGADHPNGHNVGRAELVTDFRSPTFAFVLRAPTCASMCSYSARWVWCSQLRSYWWP